MRILLTGFDPFGGETINPAYEAVQMVSDSAGGADIVKLEVPTVFRKGAAMVIEKLREINPDAVLSVGQAGGRAGITVEFVGINYIEARHPDNEGQAPDGEIIAADGEDAYFATLPAREIAEHINAHGIPASVSYSAGTYVCNDVLYSVLHYARHHAPALKAGFIHVPFAPEQVVGKREGLPSMHIGDIAKALEYAIEVIVCCGDGR